MATKKLKTANITLIGCGAAPTLTVADTATEPNATYAIESFKAEQRMKFKSGDDTYYVPFHAVDHIEVTESETQVADKPDPYGCEADLTIVMEVDESTMKMNLSVTAGEIRKAIAQGKTINVEIGDILCEYLDCKGSQPLATGLTFGGDEPNGDGGQIVIKRQPGNNPIRLAYAALTDYPSANFAPEALG